MNDIIDDYKKRMNYDMWENVIKFPRTADMINRDMNKLLKESKHLEQQSKELLNYAIRNIPTGNRRDLGLPQKKT